MDTAQYYLSNNLSDVRIMLGDPPATFPGHRMVLSRSKFFMTLISETGTNDTITIRNIVTEASFKKGLALLYGANQHVNTMTYVELAKFLVETEFMCLVRTNDVGFHIKLQGLIPSFLSNVTQETIDSFTFHDLELFVCALGSILTDKDTNSQRISIADYSLLSHRFQTLVDALLKNIRDYKLTLEMTIWLVSYFVTNKPETAFRIAFWLFRANPTMVNYTMLDLLPKNVDPKFVLSLDVGKSEQLTNFVIEYLREYFLGKGSSEKCFDFRKKCEYCPKLSSGMIVMCGKQCVDVRCGEYRCQEHLNAEDTYEAKDYLKACKCGNGLITTERIFNDYLCYPCASKIRNSTSKSSFMKDLRSNPAVLASLFGNNPPNSTNPNPNPNPATNTPNNPQLLDISSLLDMFSTLPQDLQSVVIAHTAELAKGCPDLPILVARLMVLGQNQPNNECCGVCGPDLKPPSTSTSTSTPNASSTPPTSTTSFSTQATNPYQTPPTATAFQNIPNKVPAKNVDINNKP